MSPSALRNNCVHWSYKLNTFTSFWCWSLILKITFCLTHEVLETLCIYRILVFISQKCLKG